MITIRTGLTRVWTTLALCFALTGVQPALAGNGGDDNGHFSDARQEILDVISAYSYTYDSKDVARWLTLFTDDAIFAWYGGPDKLLVVNLVGKATMKGFFEPRLANLATQGIQTRHYQTNTVFTSLKNKTATTRTIVLVTWQYASETVPRPVHTGYYEDKFVKTRDGWKFKERVIFVDHN